jgi:hypothetical protein
MRRPIKVALVGICLGVGAVVTVTAGLLGLAILRPPHCHVSAARQAAR